VVVSIAGFRGSISRKPPIELIPDMDRQPKLRPQTVSSFFSDKRSSRMPVPGTIAQSKGYTIGDKKVHAFEDHPVNTGRVTGTTNFIEATPFPITEQFMARGEQRFQIYCSPCHGGQGDGNGVTKKAGAMPVVANLHDPRIVRLSDGELFSVITHGRNLMGPYGGIVDVPDRWAIIAYLRALQLSRLGSVEDVPADLVAMLPNAAPGSKQQPAAAEPKK
jgi:hypothetical protein